MGADCTEQPSEAASVWVPPARPHSAGEPPAPTQKLWDLAILAALAALVFALYRKSLRLAWMYDDAFGIRYCIQFSLSEIFSKREVWPMKLFTPMLYATTETQLALFGFDPRAWHWLHLGILFAAGAALYLLLRLYFDRAVAAAGAVLFVAAPALCWTATQLNAVHYLHAVLFGTLAAMAYVLGVRRSDWRWSLLAALLYLVAMLAKEIAVPLVFVLPLLPDGHRRTRLRHAIAPVVAMIVFLIWRSAVLGTLLGGYGWAIAPEERLPLLLALPGKLYLAIVGANVIAGTVVLALMVMAIAALRTRRAWLLILIAIVVAVAPIVPVSLEMQSRYAIPLWIVLTIAFVAGVSALRNTRPRVALALLVAVPAIALVANRQEWSAELRRLERMSDESRLFVSLPAGSLLRNPSIAPASLGELDLLKVRHLGGRQGAGSFYDDLYLCAHPQLGSVWEYDVVRRDVVEITRTLPAIRRRHCSAIRETAPLAASFDYRDGILHWVFGPHERGRWRVVFGDGVQAFDVPRRGAYRLPDVPGIAIRVRYDSPEGWTTYSPDLALDFVHHPRYEWKR
jgi:hypothetical protein